MEQAAVKRHFLLAAGGTGGHMIPAHALAEELMRRGHVVALVTDARGAKIPGLFEGVDVHVLPAGRLGGGVLGWVKAAKGIWQGRSAAKELIREFEPAAVVGFGGYPALPTLLAALSLKLPTALHEQNAVLGRVNRLLARWVDALATAYRRSIACPPGSSPSSSAIRCAPRCWRCATSPIRRSPRTASSACSSPAAARAPASSRPSCPMRSGCCRSCCASGCR